MRTITFFCFASLVCAQDLQTRIVARPVVDLSEHWYLTTWIIGNARLHAPNNVNLFPGVGYRTKKWWFESMVQRQWSEVGNGWMFDFRFQKQLNLRNSLYLEFSPFLTRSGYYHFVIYERRTWGKLNVGAETENIQRPGLDSWGLGPRVSYPVATFGKVKLTTAIAFRVHRRERDLVRLYVVFSRK